MCLSGGKKQRFSENFEHVLNWLNTYMLAYSVVNKVKGRISKQVFQENKARQIFRKTNISYPLICTTFHIPWYAHVSVRIRGQKLFLFRKIWRALFSWNNRFEIRPFALLPAIYSAFENFNSNDISTVNSRSRTTQGTDKKSQNHILQLCIVIQ